MTQVKRQHFSGVVLCFYNFPGNSQEIAVKKIVYNTKYILIMINNDTFLTNCVQIQKGQLAGSIKIAIH